MTIHVSNEIDYLAVGFMQVDGLRKWTTSSELDAWIEEQLRLAKEATATQAWESRRESVRALLRQGGFRPSGRSKPAQEYLLRCVNEGSFPRINPAVDCLNAISVRIGLPISMLTATSFQNGCRLRVGKPGEKYVFNSGGQELELDGLIVACGEASCDVPLGSPVKDSMAGKITDSIDAVICIVYAPKQTVMQSEIDAYARELHDAIVKFAK